MTTDTKVADLPAKWRAWAKRIRGITAGSDLAADIMEGSAEDLEAALARQEADKPAAQADAPSDAAIETLALEYGIRKSDEHWGVRYYTDKGSDLFRFAGALLARYGSAQADAQAVDLPDDFSESKDWRESNYSGRVDWLKAMHASQRAEIVRLQNDVEILRALVDQQAGKGGA